MMMDLHNGKYYNNGNDNRGCIIIRGRANILLIISDDLLNNEEVVRRIPTRYQGYHNKNERDNCGAELEKPVERSQEQRRTSTIFL